MKSFKLALLAAAAVLVVAPATAQRDAPGQNDRHGGREGGFRDGGGRGNMRPTPPQAQVQQAQPRPQPQVAPPQAAPQQRGNWGGGNRFSGQPGERRAQWAGNRGEQDRGNMRPTPPQAIDPGQPQNRGQWDRAGNGQWNRNDGQPRGDRDIRNGQNDGRRNDGQWDRGNRNPGGDRRWDNDNRRDNDRRWDNNRRDNDRRGNDRGWNHDGRGNGRRPDLNWRNDHRYDWRSWRNTHRDVFHRGRYRAPYGYGYRSVYRGFFLEPFFYASSYWLSDPYEYRLPPAEWPYRWVRYYDDALLVDTTNGEVVDVIQGFFF